MAYVIITGLVVLLALWLLWTTRSRQFPKLPPGPPQEFIFGNARTMPKSHAWKYYASLSDKYGDVVSLSMFGQSTIVLNSWKAIREVLQQRSSIYNDRPVLILHGQKIGWENGTALHRDSPGWLARRKVFARHLTSKAAIRGYGNLLEYEARACVSRVLANPTERAAEMRLTFVKILMGLTYGAKVQTSADEYLVRLLTHFERLRTLRAPLVELFPLLRHFPRWFPGLRVYHNEGDAGKKELHQIVTIPFERVQRDMAAGTAAPSFCATLLEELKDNENLEKTDTAMWACASIYAAGVDSTFSTSTLFLLMMTLYPEVQRKAQEEIDRVVGQDRLPTLEDQSNLPYVEALIWELYRFHPTAPLAIPHRASQEDVYLGYRIPKGALVIPNSWAVSQDEELYPEPTIFRPERYIPTESKLAAMDPRGFAFGYGKRVCAGQNFAEAAVYSVVATFLATTTVTKALDTQGNEITPTVAFTGGNLSQPEAFECAIRPRSENSLALIHAAAEAGV